jgi:hypothetical protein
MILTVAQAQAYLEQAGFTGQGLQTMLAIWQAESNLDTTAVNPNDPNGGSFGVAQINGAHFGERWPGGIMTQLSAENPATAAAYSFYLSQGGTNFQPWGTFTDGRYQQYMNGSSSTPTPQTGTLASNTGGQSLSTFMEWVSSPARIAKMIMGMALIGMSLIALIKPEVVGQVTGGLL